MSDKLFYILGIIGMAMLVYRINTGCKFPDKTIVECFTMELE